MDVSEALLDSWDRQRRIVDAVATLVTEENRHARPSEDGWALDKQLAHIHNTRKFWLSHVAPERAAGLGKAYADAEGTPIDDLAAIKAYLVASGEAVGETVREALGKGLGPLKSENVTYDNPVLFLQHMVWHDGWHVGLIFLALRLNGQEPPEEWEEPNVWGQWRTEVW